MNYILEIAADKPPHNFVIGARAGAVVFCAQNRYTAPNDVGGSSQTKWADLVDKHALETVLGAGTCGFRDDMPTSLFINRWGSNGETARYPGPSMETIRPFLPELLKHYRSIKPRIDSITLSRTMPLAQKEEETTWTNTANEQH